MATQATLDITKLTKETAIIGKKLRQEVLGAMDDYFDEVRRVANSKYIIPDKYPGSKLRVKTKKQRICVLSVLVR